MNPDADVPHSVVAIKQEQENETEYNIQSQLPFKAHKKNEDQMCIKSEEITSYEDSDMKFKHVDRFNETMSGFEKVEQSDICRDDAGRQIKDEMCVSTWSYFTNFHTDVQEMESSNNDLHSQLVVHGTIPEKLPEDIKNTGGMEEGLKRLLVHVRKIVKNTGDITDIGGLPEQIHFEKNTRDEAGSFEMYTDIHKENTIIEAENKTKDLYLTSRDQRLNDSVKVRKCQLVLEDIMTKIIQNNDCPSLNNGECRQLSDNAFSVFKGGNKHNVRGAGYDKLFRCDVCGDFFITFSSLSSHIRKHKVEKPYRCNVCGKGFVQTNHLNAHKIAHIGKKPYKCDVCGKGFALNSNLNAHKQMHTGEKQYRCNVRDKEFIHAKDLNTHKIVHTKAKPYMCDVCGKEFTQTSHLNAHKILHTGEKPYKCNVCGKGFAFNGNLNAHKRIHTGEKPYKCNICGKEFTLTSNLNTHKRIHTEEKPYSCDVCGKGFNLTSNLNTHKRIHTGEKPYSCDVCGKQFTRTGNRNAHKRMHIGENQYRCSVCGKEFTHSASLYAHKRIHKL